MSTTIHAVIVKSATVGKTMWFWDREEAKSVFSNELADRSDDVSIYRYEFDVQDVIDEFINDAVELGDTKPVDFWPAENPEVPEYTTLRYDTQNHEILYIERTFGNEFWPYTVEKQTNTSWLVKEDGERIGRIYQDDPTALLPSYSVELRADQDPVAYGASLQEAVEALIGTVSGDFGDVK